jgi:hypothetical protein
MNKLLISYVLMTVIPLLGVLGLLQAGSRLQAPPAIGGEWALEITNAPACEAALTWQQPPAFSVSQSGRILHLTLNDDSHTMLTGRLVEGDRVVRAGNNDQQAQISLQVDIDRSVLPEQLKGVLSVGACHDPQWIVGTRLPRSETPSMGN